MRRLPLGVRSLLGLLTIVAVTAQACSSAFPASMSSHEHTYKDCAVLAAALGNISNADFNHQMAGSLKVHELALPLNDLDREWHKHLGGETILPASAGAPLRIGDCPVTRDGSSKFEIVQQPGPAPGKPSKACKIGDGIWLSRPGFNAAGTVATILVVENSCSTDGWLLRLEKSNGDKWTLVKRSNLWLSLLEDANPG